MPPVVLDQCRLFMRGKMPHAFVTWAHVDDEVHRRLSLGHPRLAPHEWKSGNHLWLIDVVTPFGGTQEVLADVQRMHFQGRSLRYLRRNAESQRNEVCTHAGSDPEAVHPPPSGKIVH